MRKVPGQFHLFHQVPITAGVGAPAVQTSIFDRFPDIAPPFRLQPWQREARKAMTHIRNELQVAPDGVGERWASALSARYPGQHKAKRIAQAFACEPRTAQGWLAGQHPQVKHLCRAAMLHGPSIVMEVMLPGTDLERETRIGDGLRDLETRLGDLRQQIEDLRGNHGPA